MPTKKRKTEGKSRIEKKARKTTEEEERGKPRQKFTRCAKEQEGDVLCIRRQETGGINERSERSNTSSVVIVVVVATVVVAAYVNVAF